MSRLFDEHVRSDASPRTACEDTFTFLNRADTPFWSEVRRVLEEWFVRYPADHAVDLRNKFRSDHPGHHMAGLWELYLHELFLRLGYDLAVHPRLRDSTKRPDFELRRGNSRMYVEAAVVFSGIVTEEPKAPPWLLDVIEKVESTCFTLWLVAVESAGSHQLKEREVVVPLQTWLDGLDPDDALLAADRGAAPEWRRISCRGWGIVFEAWPVRREARGQGGRVLGVGPAETGFVNDVEQLCSTLKSKPGQFGRPDVPAVVAVLCESSFMKRLDIEQALFGSEAVQFRLGGGADARLVRQRNGFWIRRNGPQNRRVSAVLTAVCLHHGNAADVVPELWLNPWAAHPLEESWPFPTATTSDRGEISYREAQVDMHQLLGVPLDWPGAEPFPRARNAA